MTLKNTEELKELFLSKAPDSHYYIVPAQKNYKGTIDYQAFLFNGSGKEAEKLASLVITAYDEWGNTIVEIYIGNNRYIFSENPNFCKEIINRFVPEFNKEIVYLNDI